MSKAITIICFLLSAAMFILSTAVAQAADDFKICARCHGQDGNTEDSDVPAIAGLSARYMEASMRDYRGGKRECGTSKMKCRMAAKWTDQDIVAAAAHFAQFDRAAPEQPFDSALAVKGEAIHLDHCAECHSVNAAASADSQPAGVLNAQWRGYLEYALQQYSSGGRQQPEQMRSAVEALTGDEKDAVLNYYASGR